MRPSVLVDNKRYYILDEVSRFEEGKGRRFDINGKDVAAFLHGGKIFAFGNQCPHEQKSLADGGVSHGEIICGGHGWKFNLTTGERVGGLSGGIPLYTVIVKDGYAWVAVE
jgi:nitrite reductase/ring-hydroxylating ferredoxin subunit